MGKIGKVMGDMKAAMMMVVVQVAYSGSSISFKLAANANNDRVTSFSVLAAYRALFASAFLLPLAFFIDRKKKPRITGEVLFLAFLCGLFGATLVQNLFIEAVALAGATSATAMSNLVPGVTFILAVCFGLEKMNIGRLTGKAKVVGTVTGIGGAMIMTFYKKKEIHLWPSYHLNILKHVAPHQVSTNQMIWGCVSGVGSCLADAIWLIIQAKMNEKFPWAYSSAALSSVMASIQSVIFALFMQRDWNDWKLGWDIRLFAVAYTGIVASGVAWILIAWCVVLKGPLYTSIFYPLFLVIVTIFGSVALDETLHLGSIIGFILIVLGLYMVLWGKSKELNILKDQNNNVTAVLHGGDSVKINISNQHEDGKITSTN